LATSGAIVFAQGETTASFSVPILDDGVAGGGNKAVNLTLSSPGGGGVLGAQATATLWIVE
jgi:hypothetical protein